MFLDASAIISMIAMEEDAASLAERLAKAHVPRTVALAIFEATAALVGIANTAPADAMALLDRFLTEVGATTVAIDRDTGIAAIDTFARFGKGRHPAGLNMGDCFAYASARQVSAPLLSKGTNFPRTDIRLA